MDAEIIYFQRHRVARLFRQVPVVQVLVVNDGGEDVLVSHEVCPPGRGLQLDLGALQGVGLIVNDSGISCCPTFGGRPAAMHFPWRCVLRSTPVPPPSSPGTPGRKAA